MLVQKPSADELNELTICDGHLANGKRNAVFILVCSQTSENNMCLDFASITLIFLLLLLFLMKKKKTELHVMRFNFLFIT